MSARGARYIAPAEPTLPETRRIPDAVLLLTDVVDSTRLTAAHGDERMTRLWRQHDGAARALLDRWGGLEVDRTDGFLLLFERVDDAVGWADGFHRAMAALSEELGIPVLARAGIHVGPVLLLENSEADRARGAKARELEGLAKPVAARIMSAARGGATLLSRAAVEHSAMTAARARSCGFWRMKGLEEPVELFALEQRDGDPAATVDGEKVWRVVQGPEGWRPVREIPARLPAERDAFVGRETELAALAEALGSGVRAVTLVGPGGSGKSRLAVHFAWTWLGDWPGGAWCCDLSGARDAEAICRAVAGALEVPLGRDAPEVQLGHAIAARGRCLLLLDGAEYAAEALATLLDRWLDRSSQAAFLVSSRARLRLPGERVVSVGPLAAEAGAALFVARAHAHSPDLGPERLAAADVRHLVRLLDGLPLAIELAAARARVLDPAQIAARLADRLALGGGGRGRGRHATLRAAIDWSWELLEPAQRAALAQLSVFEGGFTVEAAEVVLDMSEFSDAFSVWELLDALEEQSLIQRLDRGSWRLGMLGVIQAYAAEKLASGPVGAEGARLRHGRCFASLGDSTLAVRIHGPDGVAVRQRLAAELPNLEVAIERAVARGDASVAVPALVAARAVFTFQGPYRRALALAESVATLDLRPADRVVVLDSCAGARLECGGAERARAELAEAVALARQVPEEVGLAALLGDYGVVLGLGGDVEAGMAVVREGVAVARARGRTRDVGANLVRLGNLYDLRADHEQSRLAYEEALPLAVAAGDRATEGIVVSNLGRVQMLAGRFELAETAFRRALELARAVRAPKSECVALGNLGAVLVAMGRLVEGEEAVRAAMALSREIGNRREEQVGVCNLALLAIKRGDLAAALPWLHAALALGRDSGLPHLEMASHEVAVEVYTTAGQPGAALEHARAWLSIAQRAGQPADLRAAEAAVAAAAAALRG